MPIPDTKYNYHPLNNYSKLQLELSNNSFLYTNHFITCDICDTLVNNNINKPNKIYLTNKAAFQIHPFSNVSNCMTQFSSNNNKGFKYKKPSRNYIPDNTISSHNEIQIQKSIQNKISVSSSEHLNSLKSIEVEKNLNTNVNNKFTKHNSYSRFLNNKKANYLKSENSNSNIPKYGNKTRSFSLLTNNNLCQKTCLQ
jgi:hypothetical protein